MADREIPFAILVPSDVPAVLCGLGQVIDILLLAKAQVIPAGYLEAHHLQVGELVQQIMEIILSGLPGAGAAKGKDCSCS